VPIVSWMVADDPGDRPSSYLELHEALAAVCNRNPIKLLDAVADRRDRTGRD
jgi:hypothetical protein